MGGFAPKFACDVFHGPPTTMGDVLGEDKDSAELRKGDRVRHDFGATGIITSVTRSAADSGLLDVFNINWECVAAKPTRNRQTLLTHLYARPGTYGDARLIRASFAAVLHKFAPVSSLFRTCFAPVSR